ncbi:ParB N-terminal domain-containing protein [Brevibacillus laterosporus]|uniref:ParB N-terminal domain-containing protein n=1 Tax=Brevibacillus laterosporus TaxID=1465 RepID=A0AAP3GBT4_BRELA|nr:ParB N-terminal domain-containing protein [Brevibacillus laterosporus]MCR8981482.1 ParB N-terminal domain-containing protein [Brevibacillus laterosporus]MCZ0808637.1 ParB N-terminal domain-containing protein [Brevibacillus laterosporus]MCZ0827099.1 ParB N-terminal domain-containing protein [Brevibacillus laterosporus]MCZ0850807.1 ParB N-terminal domain-containing protein [Brevibacillus laterosporus]
MLLPIESIKVSDRIRKDFGNIEELAQDIADNGLINPPVTTPDNVLIAGERRLRACKHLGWQQIEVRVMTVRDYEHQLRMEISENENRKEFTFSERVDWARRLERVERVRAKERQSVLNGKSELTEKFPGATKGESRDIVAEQSGFGSGKQYEKAKYIADHADPEIIAQLDDAEISIHRAYTETKRKLAEKEAEVQRLTSELEGARTAVPPNETEKRLRDAEARIAEIERERDEMEASLVQSYDRIRQLERLERSVKHQQDSPLYDIFRSVTSASGYLKVFLENERFAGDVIMGAERQLVERLSVELKNIARLSEQMTVVIEGESRITVIDVTDNNKLIEVV